MVIPESFWQQVWIAWATTFWFTPTNVSQMAAQVLWFNSSIKANGKVIFYPQAYTAGILCVFNIWNSAENRYLNFREITTIYGQSITFLQYYSLLNSIPGEWTRAMISVTNVLDDYIFPYEFFHGKQSNIVYRKLVDDPKALTRTAEKWNTVLNLDLPYENFLQAFEDLYKWVTDTKLRNFQFRYLHRAIYGAKVLYTWGIVDSPRCLFCQDNYETLEHLFYQCPIVARFWQQLISWYEAMTDTEITINLENISFCNHELDLINTLILIAKQFIFARRANKREPNIYLFKERVMLIVKVERQNAFNTGKFKPFVKKWKKLFPLVD